MCHVSLTSASSALISPSQWCLNQQVHFAGSSAWDPHDLCGVNQLWTFLFTVMLKIHNNAMVNTTITLFSHSNRFWPELVIIHLWYTALSLSPSPSRRFSWGVANHAKAYRKGLRRWTEDPNDKLHETMLNFLITRLSISAVPRLNAWPLGHRTPPQYWAFMAWPRSHVAPQPPRHMGIVTWLLPPMNHHLDSCDRSLAGKSPYFTEKPWETMNIEWIFHCHFSAPKG